jgi:hypothetical protein
MERREFIEVVALSMLTLGTNERSAQASSDVRVSHSMMDAYLRKFDENMSFMAAEPMDDFYRVLQEGTAPRVVAANRSHQDAVLRKILRSMYVSVSFRELPEHGRLHPGMQQRVRAAMAEMDEVVFSARDYLLGLSSADRLDLSHRVRENPELLPRLARHMDARGQSVGLTPRGREQLSRHILHIDRQLRRSDAGVVLDEYVARADSVLAQAGSPTDFARKLSQIMSAPAFYSAQQRQAELVQSWWEKPPPTDYPGAGEVFRMGPPPAPMDPQIAAQRRASGEGLLTTGGLLFGIGCISTLLGGVFIPWTMGLSSFAITPGVGMMVAGAICMGIGRARMNTK